MSKRSAFAWSRHRKKSTCTGAGGAKNVSRGLPRSDDNRVTPTSRRTHSCSAVEIVSKTSRQVARTNSPKLPSRERGPGCRSRTIPVGSDVGVAVGVGVACGVAPPVASGAETGAGLGSAAARAVDGGETAGLDPTEPNVAAMARTTRPARAARRRHARICSRPPEPAPSRPRILVERAEMTGPARIAGARHDEARPAYRRSRTTIAPDYLRQRLTHVT